MMSLMDWNDKLDIGVHSMNEEHKHLLGLMNKLFELYEKNASFMEQKKTLDDLKNYTVKHFQDEEQYMESIHFEGLKQHKIIHQQLIEKFLKFYGEFESKKMMDENFFEFLKMWLNAHIQGIDKKYGEQTLKSKKSA